MRKNAFVRPIVAAILKMGAIFNLRQVENEFSTLYYMGIETKIIKIDQVQPFLWGHLFQ